MSNYNCKIQRENEMLNERLTKPGEVMAIYGCMSCKLKEKRENEKLRSKLAAIKEEFTEGSGCYALSNYRQALLRKFFPEET